MSNLNRIDPPSPEEQGECDCCGDSLYASDDFPTANSRECDFCGATVCELCAHEGGCEICDPRGDD
jgi:hypothetical protein